MSIGNIKIYPGDNIFGAGNQPGTVESDNSLDVLKESLRSILVSTRVFIDVKLINNLPLVISTNMVANKQFIKAVLGHLADDYTILSIREDDSISGPEFTIPSVRSELFESFLSKMIAIPSITLVDRRAIVDTLVLETSFSNLNAIQFREKLVEILCKLKLGELHYITNKEFLSVLKGMNCLGQQLSLKHDRVLLDNDSFLKLPLNDSNNTKENIKHLQMIQIPNTTIAFRNQIMRHLDMSPKNLTANNLSKFYDLLTTVQFTSTTAEHAITNITPLYMQELSLLADPAGNFIYVESVEKVEYFVKNCGQKYCPSWNMKCYSFWGTVDLPVNFQNKNMQIKHLHKISSKLASELASLELILGMGAIAFGLSLSILQIVSQVSFMLPMIM